MKTISLSTLTQRVLHQRARVAERREHDNAMRDSRLAFEHYASRQRSIERGAPDCNYCD